MADNEDFASAEHANTRTPAVKTSARLQLFIVFIFQPPVLLNKPFTMASTRKNHREWYEKPSTLLELQVSRNRKSDIPHPNDKPSRAENSQ